MSTVTQTPTRSNNDRNITDDAREKAKELSGSLVKRWSDIAIETRRTICYAAAAISCIAITGFVEWSSRPARIEEFGKVGQPFFPDFEDPTKAVALTVSAIDGDQVSAQEFSVERKDNGQWVIPSHHDYPADAEEQLASTASSVIGISRGAMVSRWASDHARYGVVNPKTDALGVDEIQGVGKRLTLRGEGDTILADYIIGNQVDGEFDQYYVRHPDEDETYVATLNIDLSTRFADWIDTDLLDINSFDVVNFSVNDYQFNELDSTITKQEVITLRRSSSSDDWKIEGISDESLEVNEDSVRDSLSALASVEISGIRPKQAGLTPDLQLDRSALGSQRDVDRLQADLLSRGFLLQPASESEPDKLKLIAREGELSTATDEGLVYNLYFGRAFTGSQEELEIGFGDSDAGSSNDDPSTSNDNSDDGDDSTDGDEASDSDENSEEDSKSSKPGRYVFVTVNFDEQYLGERPQKPIEPEMPEALRKAEESTEDQDNDVDDAEVESGTEQEKDGTESKSSKETGESSESADDELDRLREEYGQAKKEYEEALKDWEEFEYKVESGKQKAEELNRRFAEWYYVIPGEDYDKLTLTRNDLLEEKESEETTESESEPVTDSGASESVNQEDEVGAGSEEAKEDQTGAEAAEETAVKASPKEDTESNRPSENAKEELGIPEEQPDKAEDAENATQSQAVDSSTGSNSE